MRILILTDRWSDRGGADLHLQDVANGLHARGHSITFAFGSGSPPPEIPFPTIKLRTLARMISHNRGLDRLSALLKQHDLAMVQNVMNPLALGRITKHHPHTTMVTIQDHRLFCPGPGRTLPDGSACTSPMEDRTCTVCLPEATYRTKTLALTQARIDALRNSATMVLSHNMALGVEQAGFNTPSIIPPWVSASHSHLANHARDGFVLGGRLVHHKAPMIAWRAWDEAGRPQPLFVAGEGPLKDQLEGSVPLGWLPRTQWQQRIAQSTALLFPTRWQEPFGIVGLEALAVGTPVVVIRRGGIEDWAQEGCIVVDTESQMRDAILLLHQEPRYARELGSKGQAWAHKAFSAQTALNKIEAKCLEMTQGRAQPNTPPKKS